MSTGLRLKRRGDGTEAFLLAACRGLPMMKILLLLAFIAVASEAIAQDAQCVPERAAMVETVRAYARTEAGVGAARHIGDRPAGYGANGTPPVHAWAFLLASIHGRAGTHWQGPNNIAAVHSRADDPFRGSQIRPYRPGSWHWFRLPGRNTGASGAKSLYR